MYPAAKAVEKNSTNQLLPQDPVACHLLTVQDVPINCLSYPTHVHPSNLLTACVGQQNCHIASGNTVLS